ncbi:MAG TPA: Rrf2 family transcriptional regulator [Acidisarcina sp.]|nr:Rrf2 family transcriptional regulator [Acidisarcina sp.]
MFRLNKLTDYGLVVMQYLGGCSRTELHTTRELIAATQLPSATIVKILKALLDRKLLISYRGIKGGYALARCPSEISVAEIIEALEGPIGFTECATTPGYCLLEGTCGVQHNSHVISRALQQTLEGITLSDLTTSLRLGTRTPGRGSALTAITVGTGRVQ